MLFKKIAFLFVFMKVIGVEAQIQPFSLISDNMVLQRNIAVPLWGKAIGSKIVVIEFNGQKKQVDVADGKWIIILDPMKESSLPLEMHIKTDKDEIILHNILIGDVWLAGGQSNMERQLGPRPPQKPLVNWESEAAQANYPSIREFSMPHNSNRLIPVETINSKWLVCDSQNVKSFSAVGYYFAKNLQKNINIPIGIIHSSLGGTAVQKWMSKESLTNNAEFKSVIDDYTSAIANYPFALKSFHKNKDSLYKKWTLDSAIAIKSNKTLPRKPSTPIDPELSGDCGGLYQTMIEPLISYAIKGVIWYQGEANVSNPSLYRKLFPALIEDWRAKWMIGDFPFLFVQLAPYKTNTPEIREVQLLTSEKIPNTGMVVTIDCGDTADVHPPFKNVVGERLALAARALVYKEKRLEYSGPIYKTYKIKSGKIKISFTHIGKGLVQKGSELNGFTITENGKEFVKAKAKIEHNKVIVFADGINNPLAVRYAFSNNAEGNLFNENGLPASPFRTDISVNR